MKAESISDRKNTSFTFKRWSRKPWGIFSSLGKNIRIGVLLVNFSILVLPGKGQDLPDSSFHNDGSSKEIELEEIVVTAQRSPVLQSELLRVVTVITRAEIEQSGYAGLAGLLEFVSGVDLRQRGSQGIQSDISIRGGSFDQTMILLNGINLTDPQTGHHNLNLPVDLNSIQRIEVLKGPGARIFGPNAFNGAINIITGESKEKELDGYLSIGQYHTGEMGLSMSTPFKNTFHYLSLSGSLSDGYTSNTDYSNSNIFYRLQIPYSVLNLDLQAGYNAKAFGANSFYTPRFPDQFEATRSKFLALKIRLPDNVRLSLQTYWRRHNDRFELFRDSTPAWYTTHNYHMTDVIGSLLNWSLIRDNSRNNFGIDYRYEHVVSNVLGELIFETIPVAGTDSVFYNRAYSRGGLSLIGEHSLWYGKFSLSGGLLIYFNKSLPEGVSVYPGLDLGYELTKQIRMYASVNRTLRLPTFTDMFYNGPSNEGNINLMPEEAIMAELGGNLSTRYLFFNFSVFRRWGKNMIDWVRLANDEKWRSMNLTEVNIDGMETSLQYKWPENRFIEDTKLEYSWYISSKESFNFQSLYVLDNLKHKLDITILHKVNKASGLSWKLSLQDRNGGFQPYENGEYLKEIEYKPILIIDLKGHYNIKYWQFFISVSNLLNTKIVDHANVDQPGIWAKTGVRFSLKAK